MTRQEEYRTFELVIAYLLMIAFIVISQLAIYGKPHNLPVSLKYVPWYAWVIWVFSVSNFIGLRRFTKLDGWLSKKLKSEETEKELRRREYNEIKALLREFDGEGEGK